MSDIVIAKAPGPKAVVPFYATAAIAFLAVALMMFFSTTAFGGHYFHPKLLAIVHTAALGWGTMIAMGASYQLLPVIFERDLFSEKLARLSWLLLVPGVILLSWSFWNFNVDVPMKTGAVLIFTSIVCFVLNIMFTGMKTNKYSIQKLFITTSAFWLLFTATMGVLLVFNFTQPFISDHIRFLKMHAHAGLAGWFLLLIFGTGSKLIPMFLLSKPKREFLLLISYTLINTGLLLFISGEYFEGGKFISLMSHFIVFWGIVSFLLFARDVYVHRVKKDLDTQLKQTYFSLFLLFVAMLIIPFLVYITDDYRLSILYGFTVFIGWITSILLGQTFKTLPFIVWNSRYRLLTGKMKIPMPKHLYNEKLLPYQFYLYIVSLVTFALGIFMQVERLLMLSSFFLVIVALLYNYNVFRIIFHRPVIAHAA